MRQPKKERPGRSRGVLASIDKGDQFIRVGKVLHGGLLEADTPLAAGGVPAAAWPRMTRPSIAAVVAMMSCAREDSAWWAGDEEWIDMGTSLGNEPGPVNDALFICMCAFRPCGDGRVGRSRRRFRAAAGPACSARDAFRRPDMGTAQGLRRHASTV